MTRVKRIVATDEALLAIAFVTGLCLLAPMITVPLSWTEQAWLGVGFVTVAVFVNRLVQTRAVTFFLMAISLFMTARYAYWRAVNTLGFGTPGYSWFDLTITFSLFAAEVYAWLVLVLGYLQTAWPLERPPSPLPDDSNAWPTVDIYIPTYNEALSVVRPTVLASLGLDWPRDKFSVYILDDGVRPEFRAFAEEVGAGYITRSQHTHAKAGNLNNALSKTQGEYIAIFDCDHVPTRSFLQVTMGLFGKDKNLGLVQTPHHFYSPDPFEKNLKVFKQIPNEGDLFYGVVQDGNDLWNSAFFCGSCAVMRRSALEEIGGIATETVTEDAHTSLKFQRKGWNSAYLNVPQAAGLATDSFGGHIGQRIRWARGMAQIMRIDNPLGGKGLRPMQRLCYLNAMLHFFFAIPRLIFLTAPLFYLYFGVYVISAYALAIAAYSIPHLVLATIANSRVQGRHRNSFWNEVYETALAPYIALPTLLAVINPKLGKFNVTAKGGLVQKSYFDRALARPFIVLFLLNCGGLIAGTLRWYLLPHASLATIVMTTVWTLYNLIIISVVLGVNWESRQVRGSVRIPFHKLAFIYKGDGSRTHGRTIDLSEGGVGIEGTAQIALSESVVVGIVFDRGEFRFPAAMASEKDSVMRFQFESLNNEQYADLVRILYGRADAWIGWGSARDPDRPWRSLLQVTKLAFVGVARLVRGMKGQTDRSQVETNQVQGERKKSVSRRATAALAWPLVTAISLFVCGGQRAYAAGPAPGASDIVRTWTIAELGHKNGLRLTGVNDTQGISVSIPPNRVVGSAHMTLRYHLSPGLLPKISQINVLLNGRVIRSLPVTPTQDKGQAHTARFRVNPNLFSQYNHIGFQLIGHYTLGCENSANSTLWATISPATRLTLDAARLAVADDLRSLPAPFFYKSRQSRLTIPFVFFSQPNPGEEQAAGIVASWFGDLASYRGASFPVREGGLPPTGNAVVFATSADMPPLAGVPNVTGPMVVMTANPNDPYGKILWVLGSDSRQLVTAARALVVASATFSGAVAHIGEFHLPEKAKADTAPRWVPSDGPVRLSVLSGFNPMTVTGTGTIPFTFYLPPSLFLWDQTGVPIRIHYGYNPIPIAKNSTLNLDANSTYVHAFKLPPGGRHQEHWADLTFPAATLGPYANSLAATFYFVPKKGKCTGTNVYNAAGGIYPDSTITLGGIPHYARMPNLALWMNGGYPFSRYDDLSQTAAVLPAAPTSAIIHTFLNTMGLLGEEMGAPGIRLAVVSSASVQTVASRNLLVFAAPGGRILSGWGTRLPVNDSRNGVQIHTLEGWFSNPKWRFPWWDGHSTPYGRKALGALVADGPEPAALMEEIVSPLHADRAMLLFAATSSNGWHSLRTMAATASKRKDVFGDVTIVHAEHVSSFYLHTPHYYVGHLSIWTWLRYRLSNHPWVIWLFIIIVTLILARVVSALLGRRAAKRLRGGS